MLYSPCLLLFALKQSLHGWKVSIRKEDSTVTYKFVTESTMIAVFLSTIHLGTIPMAWLLYISVFVVDVGLIIAPLCGECQNNLAVKLSDWAGQDLGSESHSTMTLHDWLVRMSLSAEPILQACCENNKEVVGVDTVKTTKQMDGRPIEKKELSLKY